MRKTLWDVKSILNKREKHLRGRHDQRDHNRWPAGYQAQTYTPSGRRAAVMQGRSSGSLSSMTAPPKGKLPAGVVQTSMFNEPVIAPVAPDKSQREQLLDDIRGKSRAMYARTDDFMNIVDSMKATILNSGLMPQNFDNDYIIRRFFSNTTSYAVDLGVDITTPKWYENIDYKDLRQKFTQIISSNSTLADRGVAHFEILADFHRYQDELKEASISVANSIKSYTVTYKEKHDEADDLRKQAKKIQTQHENDLDNLIRDVLYSDDASDEEAALSEEYSVANSAIMRTLREVNKLQDELTDAQEELDNIKKQEEKRKKLRRSGVTVVGSIQGSSLTQMVKIADIRDRIDIEKQKMMEYAERRENAKKEFIKINAKAQKMISDNQKEVDRLNLQASRIINQNSVLDMYTEIFSSMARDDGFENVTFNGADKVFIDDKASTLMIKSIFKMIPKQISDDDNTRTSSTLLATSASDSTEIEEVTINFTKTSDSRAFFTDGQRRIVNGKFQADGTIAFSGAATASTVAHESIHAIQHIFRRVFWMHLASYINQKTGKDGASIVDRGTKPIKTLNALAKKTGRGNTYKPHEKGYETDLADEYIFKVYENMGYNAYTELQEIHTQAVSNWLRISENPDAEILDYFVQSVLGLPSTGSKISYMYTMIMRNLDMIKSYREKINTP